MKYFLIGILIATSQILYAGPRVVKNGGDLDAIEFVGIGEQLLKLISNEKNSFSFDFNKLSKAVDEAKVESTTKKLTIDGADKDAINNPLDKTIIFNRIAWAGKGDLTKKAILVLHEYFGLAGITDQKYNISISVVEKVGFGKINYRGEIYDRKLSKEEIAKLLPLYLNIISIQANKLPSPIDNNVLKLMGVVTAGVTYPSENNKGGSVIANIQDTIKSLQNYVNELKEVTPEDRFQSTMFVIEGFKNSLNRVTCELGYKSVTRSERIVKCVDLHRSSSSALDDEGSIDERTIILSVEVGI